MKKHLWFLLAVLERARAMLPLVRMAEVALELAK